MLERLYPAVSLQCLMVLYQCRHDDEAHKHHVSKTIIIIISLHVCSQVIINATVQILPLYR